RAVERRAGEVALELQIPGRRLGLGERTDRVRGLLEAGAARADGVLADGASALAGDAAGLDNRLNVGASEIGELTGNLLAALDDLLAALVGVGEERLERREGRNFEEIGVGHGFNPLLGRARWLASGDTILAADRLGAASDGLFGGRLALCPAGGGGTLHLGRLLALLGDRLDLVGNRFGDFGRSLGNSLGFNLGFVCHPTFL